MNLLQHIFCFNIVQNYRYKKAYRKWLQSGKPIPTPNAVKQMIVKEYANRFKTNIFIETGTYLGDMVSEMINIFSKIYSIELSDKLYERAKKKFSGYKHISILKGDSSKVLPEILNKIEKPCLFWLDAHYSKGITAKGEKETPVVEELKHILDHPIEDHVILIDDARCFTGQNNYPSLEELNKIILDKYPDYIFKVRNDIICSHKISSLLLPHI